MLLAQHNEVVAVDIIPEIVEKINKRISPIQDDYKEKYLDDASKGTRNLRLIATIDGASAYKEADYQVTIGSNTLVDSKGQGAPTIGDNVYIGAGAKIIGKVTIGNNVRIGANCVVTKDVPDNTTVVSAPIRFIEKTEKMNNIFVKY